MEIIIKKSIEKNEKKLIKQCHLCGHIHETKKEIMKCQKCKKSFLPLNSFEYINKYFDQEYKNLYSDCSEISSEDLVIGIYAFWD